VTLVRTLLFAFGYPVSIVVIARFVPVVRERRQRWLAIHHVAVACIVLGWALDSNWQAVGVNSTWLVVSTLWYVRGRRRHGP
jgi:tryptophan-rich sensory protein